MLYTLCPCSVVAYRRYKLHVPDPQCPLVDVACLSEGAGLCDVIDNDKSTGDLHVLIPHSRILLLTRCVQDVQHAGLRND